MTTLLYLISAAVATTGAAYASVPLYRVFCQSTSYGGTVKEGHDIEKVETMEPVKDRLLTIRFNADTAAQMRSVASPQHHHHTQFGCELNSDYVQVEFQTPATCCLRTSRRDSPGILHSQESNRKVRVVDNL